MSTEPRGIKIISISFGYNKLAYDYFMAAPPKVCPADRTWLAGLADWNPGKVAAGIGDYPPECYIPP
jgi:hypothetical protein